MPALHLLMGKQSTADINHCLLKPKAPLSVYNDIGLVLHVYSGYCKYNLGVLLFFKWKKDKMILFSLRENLNNMIKKKKKGCTRLFFTQTYAALLFHNDRFSTACKFPESL